MEICTEHDYPEGARFCIRCGASCAATGATERLESDDDWIVETEYKEFIYEGDSQSIIRRIPISTTRRRRQKDTPSAG